jgi:tRNA-2-methylthio-N6-dimethylallyladenosine synthase
MKNKIISKPDLIKAKNRNPGKSDIIYLNNEVSDFLLEFAKNKKYFIRTYGCQANVRDEESMKGMLEGVGFSQVDKEQDADVIILNTCAVRENAEDKVYGEIGNLKALKLKNKDLIIALCGCMVEQPEILEKVLNTYPHVNLIYGTHEVHNLLNYLEEVIKTKQRLISVESKEGEVYEGLPACRNNKYKAFVNIIYGCNKFCSYCIVPYARGKERSRMFNDIVKECEELVKNGYQEITLLGQNVNAYGKDLNEDYDFADLLEAVAKTGIARLRFTTSHPWDFSNKMIDVIAKYDNIMKCIHLPVQSGNDEILKLMGRRYDSKHYMDLVTTMKNKIPGLTLSTDIIVGFPNESEEQFLDTLKLVDFVKYDSAFTFIYSPRRGTPAAKMVDNISYQEKVVRFKELVKHLENTISASAEKMVGNVYKVLVDGPSKTDKNMFSGYTECNRLVHFKGDETMVGKIINVKILENKVYSLKGEIVNG